MYTSAISTLIVLPVNLLIITLFRKAKVKAPKKTTKTKHVAKQNYWRRVEIVESVDGKSSASSSSSTTFGSTDTSMMSLQSSRPSVLSERDLLPPIGFDGRTRDGFATRILDKIKTIGSGDDVGGEYKRESREDARNKKQGRTLAHWVIYISWFRKSFRKKRFYKVHFFLYICVCMCECSCCC